MTWNDVALKWGTDKATVGPRNGVGHGYAQHYERVLASREINSILEIGVQSGASLYLWAALFPSARVVGIDTDKDCGYLNGPFEVYIGDAGDQAVGQAIAGTFDVIVDDGSHAAAHTAANLDVWASRLNPGGVYVVEDCVIGSTSWIQSLNDVVDMLLAHGLTPFTIERGQMRWVAHQHYGGMMAVVFADAACEVPT